MTGATHSCRSCRPGRPVQFLTLLLAAVALWAPLPSWAESPYTTPPPSPTPPPSRTPAPPKPQRTPRNDTLPQTPPSEPLDTGRPTRAAMQLKNNQQINLLNVLAVTDMSDWPHTLKKNRSILNEDFVKVMGLRGQDAFSIAISNRANEREARRYFEIAFRYMILADLCAEQIHIKSDYRMALGRQCLRGGAPDLALAICQNVLVLEKDNLAARLLSGEIHMATGAFYEALEDYRIVVKKDPKNDNAWTKMAYIYFFLHDLPKTGDALRKALAVNSSNRDAKALQYKLDHPEQLPAPDQLPPLGPENAGTPQQIADALAAKGLELMKAGNLVEAEKELRNALRANPNCASAHMGLGDLHFRTSKFQLAVDEYVLAGKFAPTNAEPMRYLALSCEKIYDQSGDINWLDRAIGYIKDSISRKSDYAAAKADQERLLEKKTRLIMPKK